MCDFYTWRRYKHAHWEKIIDYLVSGWSMINKANNWMSEKAKLEKISVPCWGWGSLNLERKNKLGVWYIWELEDRMPSFLSLIHFLPTFANKVTWMMLSLYQTDLGLINLNQKGLPVSHTQHEIGCYKKDDIYRKEWSVRDRFIFRKAG